MCAEQDINNCDTVDLACPDNTEINKLVEFGIQADSGKASVCPISLANSTAIDLNLMKQCSITRDDTDYFDEFQVKVEKWFKPCIGKQTCKMKIYDKDTFPEVCNNLIISNG